MLMDLDTLNKVDLSNHREAIQLADVKMIISLNV